MKLSEMTTLASVGDMPALPLGMGYPRRMGWLAGKARKSKRIKFRRPSGKKESMKLLIVRDVSPYFNEAVDSVQRGRRLKKLFKYADGKSREADHLSFGSHGFSGSHYGSGHAKRVRDTMARVAAGKSNRALDILKKHGLQKHVTATSHGRSWPYTFGMDYTKFHRVNKTIGTRDGGTERSIAIGALRKAGELRKSMTMKDKKTGKLRLKLTAKRSSYFPQYGRSASTKGAHAAEMKLSKTYKKTHLP